MIRLFARLARLLSGERGGVNVTIGSAAATVVAIVAIGAGAIVVPTITGGSDPCAGFSFCDEFNGSTLDTSKWVAVDNTIGNSGMNQCDKASNAAVAGGYLTETFQFGSFTCPGVPTGAPAGTLSCSAGTCSTHFADEDVQARDFAFAYGTMEVKAKTQGPSTTFAWPGYWLLGHDCQHPQYLVAGADAPGCAWPNAGSEEIDTPDLPQGTATKWDFQINASGSVGCQTSIADASQAFHTYKLVWTHSTLTWFFDGSQTCTKANTMSGEPVFPILQSAYDGNDSQIPTVTVSQIDYVHITVAGPDATVKPSITGSTTQGNVLTEHDGTWTGNPTSFTRQWLRCSSTGVACSLISGATATTYTTTTSDVGHEVQVLVIGSNASGATQWGSAPTSPIT